jgi:hypothetical protein
VYFLLNSPKIVRCYRINQMFVEEVYMSMSSFCESPPAAYFFFFGRKVLEVLATWHPLADYSKGRACDSVWLYLNLLLDVVAGG